MQIPIIIHILDITYQVETYQAEYQEETYQVETILMIDLIILVRSGLKNGRQ